MASVVLVWPNATHVWRDWRGGWITALGATATIAVQIEAHARKTFAGVDLALVPVGARSIGCPVVCRVTGDAIATYTIAEVVGSVYAPGSRREIRRQRWRPVRFFREFISPTVAHICGSRGGW